MDNKSLFPLKYRLRKTDEPVEIVAWETAEKGARSESDWVSYIDSFGVEYIKEHLTLEWDFVAEDPFSGGILGGLTDSIAKMDPWEARRYELVKGMWLADDFGGLTIPEMVSEADKIISALKRSPEPAKEEDGYDNIGIGETVSDDGTEIFRKVIFTDRKDIVGYEGDSGRWKVGDRVKVYIKRLDPQEEERPVP